MLWFTIPPHCGSLLHPRPRPPSAYRALPCLAARSRSATRASAAPHPVHPAQPPAAQPPFAEPPPWSWQSQVPRRTRRRTANTASATTTKPMMTVAGLISNGSTSRLLPTAPLPAHHFFVQMFHVKHSRALAPERAERRAQDASGARFRRLLTRLMRRPSRLRAEQPRPNRRTSAWGGTAGTAARPALRTPRRSTR